MRRLGGDTQLDAGQGGDARLALAAVLVVRPTAVLFP